jgi:hypothetical protein
MSNVLLEKRVPRGFFGCPHRRNLLDSRENLLWFHIELFVERVLHGTQKGYTWNQKGFFNGDS